MSISFFITPCLTRHLDLQEAARRKTLRTAPSLAHKGAVLKGLGVRN